MNDLVLFLKSFTSVVFSVVFKRRQKNIEFFSEAKKIEDSMSIYKVHTLAAVGRALLHQVCTFYILASMHFLHRKYVKYDFGNHPMSRLASGQIPFLNLILLLSSLLLPHRIDLHVSVFQTSLSCASRGRLPIHLSSRQQTVDSSLLSK